MSRLNLLSFLPIISNMVNVEINTKTIKIRETYDFSNNAGINP